MKSVIVRDMELPERCDICPFCGWIRAEGKVYCHAIRTIGMKLIASNIYTQTEIPYPLWCPLEEVEHPYFLHTLRPPANRQTKNHA